MQIVTVLVFILYSIVAHADVIDDIIYTDHLTLPFIVADKSAGTITVVNPISNHRTQTSALYGKMQADVLSMQLYDMPLAPPPYITPAGKFTLTRMYSEILHENILAFLEGNTIVMSIHAVYTGNPAQQRLARLKSADPLQHRITNGCINVEPHSLTSCSTCLHIYYCMYYPRLQIKCIFSLY